MDRVIVVFVLIFCSAYLGSAYQKIANRDLVVKTMCEEDTIRGLCSIGYRDPTNQNKCVAEAIHSIYNWRSTNERTNP